MSRAVIEAKPYLCLDLNGTLMSPEEFDAVEACDELYRYELIDGRLIVTPPPLEGERDPNEELGHMLRDYKNHDPEGAALDKTLYEQEIRLKKNRRRADRAIWAGLGRVPDPKVDVPSIVVEFVSRAKRDRRRDYQEKRREYGKAGIAEYWIVDRFHRKMTVFINQPEGSREVVVGEEDTYQTPLLPGFSLVLARLLGVADSWKDEA